MTASLKSQLAAALKRVDELERALVTFEAMSPDVRELERNSVRLTSGLRDAVTQRDSAQSEVQRMLSQIGALDAKLSEAEWAMSHVLGAKSREEVEWIVNKYIGVNQPVSTYDPYSRSPMARPDAKHRVDRSSYENPGYRREIWIP